ncbi:hypothetical protein [Stenotrophomonas sepilia]|uniref:hypothetical protein n=1 Tax=Stenotrophomonas sepilia TaxID=2860290 RepID=UPI001F2F0375|nr:hypothetical protein [Stenotrophomonas sepilia]MDJ1623592.1 hypothetical protein [Stenotrophomonas sepilia]
MSNDNKTLADVQPGGRVRLGDEAERARFEAWAHAQSYRGGNIMADRDAVHPDVYADPIAQLTWKSWQAALSAQPSTGGQDALHGAARRVISDIDSGDYGGTISMATYDALVAALAARQPVSETDAYQQGFRDGQDRTCTVAARQPVGEDHLREAIATVCEGWTLPADARKILEKAMWEYVPPAQAVDLGQFRLPVQDWLDDAQASMEAQGDYDGVFGYAIEEGTRLLALIDSQAVGNG